MVIRGHLYFLGISIWNLVIALRQHRKRPCVVVYSLDTHHDRPRFAKRTSTLGNKLEAALGTTARAPVEPKQLRDLHIDLRVPERSAARLIENSMLQR